MPRYHDVLRPGWQRADVSTTTDVELRLGMVVEEGLTGFCGAVLRWENGLVVLEDRHGKKRSFPLGPGFLLDGKPVALKVPARVPPARTRHTASGSRVAPSKPAKVALPSRIYVEGRHDAELVEKIWGDDLRYVGVAVEYLGGVDDLVALVDAFRPAPGRRLGVLVDHLVPGSKESRLAQAVMAGPYGQHVLVTGHQFIDIWQAVRPERVGLKRWPDVPKGRDIKAGICDALRLPHADQADIARAWQAILRRVDGWQHVETGLITEVERLIDFVTA